MEMIKFIENDLVIVLSNIGEYFFINSKTKSVHIHNFPSKKSTSSWSLFYDHILRAEYLVSYNNDNSYDFYDKGDLSRSINTYPITGFADHIVKGHLLIRKKINGYDSYLLKSLK